MGVSMRVATFGIILDSVSHLVSVMRLDVKHPKYRIGMSLLHFPDTGKPQMASDE